MNAINTETKYVYRHKPTGKWVRLYTGFYDNRPYMDFHDKFHPEMLSNKKSTELVFRSTINREKYAAQNFLEFELVEIEIQYKVKEEEYAEIRIWENSTGWPN